MNAAMAVSARADVYDHFAMREPTSEPERKAIADVQSHGWHVVKVMEDSEGPAFAYTVGLQHSFAHPELIVVGLSLDVGHAILNTAGESIRRGVRYAAGLQSDGVLKSRACTFREMPESQFRNYMGWALWFYDGPFFSALQLIWPDHDDRWPWDPSVDPEFCEMQPVIANQGDPPWASRAPE
jgi:hypothetical protein